MSRNIATGKGHRSIAKQPAPSKVRKKRGSGLRESEKHWAQKLANWEQIEAGRAELRAGGGKTLEQVLADAQRTAHEGGRK